jgi:N-acetylglutamate synthase-like GNAT family acetyltransferase
MRGVGAPPEGVQFRDGRVADERAAFELGERALAQTARSMGVRGAQQADLDGEELERRWSRRRRMVEFVGAQEGTRFVVCEGPEGLVGFARVLDFGRMEELSQVMVEPSWHGRGIGRELLERCWSGAPSPAVGRLVVAAGSMVDLSLYTEFGVMPVTGHWHLAERAERYVERRQHEYESTEPDVHVLEEDRAVGEWKRLEPRAIGFERPALHEFLGRERSCLACMGEDGLASALCWVSGDGDIGPGVAATSEDLLPVLLAALDRVAKAREPEELHVFCTTDAWWLLRRLRGLGFRLFWPSWVLCSVPLPGLDRYVPTRPALML